MAVHRRLYVLVRFSSVCTFTSHVFVQNFHLLRFLYDATHSMLLSEQLILSTITRCRPKDPLPSVDLEVNYFALACQAGFTHRALV